MSFCAARSFALRDLEFKSNSVSSATSGFLVSIATSGLSPHTQTGALGGQVQGFAMVLENVLNDSVIQKSEKL